MIDTQTLLTIVWLHFFADFILQSDYIAINKSKKNVILLIHVLMYSFVFMWFGWLFALINGVAHFITDYITSRITSRLWQDGKTHWFFVVIGADQAIHISTLLITYTHLQP